MYQKILVPLDGSELAECALPHAEELAVGCNVGEIILISVTEPLTYKTDVPEMQELYRSSDRADVSGSGSGVRVTFGKMQKQAEKYLNRIAIGLEDKGIRVRTEVLLGKPAEEIVGFAEREGLDIIVISSHGRSGPSRWVQGSVADKVLRSSCVPILMIRAPGCVIGM